MRIVNDIIKCDMDLYKFDKTMRCNDITHRQFKKLYQNFDLNVYAFNKIVANPKFDLKFDNNKILVGCVIVLQNDYKDVHERVKIIRPIISKEEVPAEFVERVLYQARVYSTSVYYRLQNNDKIPVPKEILGEFREHFAPSYTPTRGEYVGDNPDAKKLINFLYENSKFTYMIMDIYLTGHISSYIYKRLDLQFLNGTEGILDDEGATKEETAYLFR